LTCPYYYDSWDGGHPRVFTPASKPYVQFESGEEINNYLLRDPEVQAYITSRGGRPKVAMVFFNEETEQICAELGYDLILPSHALRQRLDSKIVTTILGNEAGAPSVTNVLVEQIDSWPTLIRVAFLPAEIRSRRLPLQGRRPRHSRHQMPHAERRRPQ
jgi:hypothetical protein